MKKPAAGSRKRPATAVKPKVEKAKAKPKQRTRVLVGTKGRHYDGIIAFWIILGLSCSKTTEFTVDGESQHKQV